MASLYADSVGMIFHSRSARCLHRACERLIDLRRHGIVALIIGITHDIMPL